MVKLEFQDLVFSDDGDFVKVIFLKMFNFKIAKKELLKIGKFETLGRGIEFEGSSEKKVVNKFNSLIDKGLLDLRNNLTGRKAVYIHKNSGIPLMGYNAFGIIDRDTNLLELRPNTGCNLSCVFCSVDEGWDSKRVIDYVVESDYLVSWVKKIVSLKGEGVHLYINPQGEPTLYGGLVELVSGLSKIPNVEKIAMNTNGIVLTKRLIDDLVSAGLDRFNVSLNSIDKKTADKLAGFNYNVEHVMKMIKYAAGKCEVIIAPVWLKGWNDDEIEKLVKFSKEAGCRIGIQNFLSYPGGRNPDSSMPFDDFFAKLKEYEKKYDVKLILSASDLEVHDCKVLERPFKKGEVVKAEIVLDGRFKGEKIAVARDRCIAVPNCDRKGFVKLRITKTKHNLFSGELA